MTLGFLAVPGWVILGIGAYRAGVTGIVGALIIAFGSFAFVPGTLKEMSVHGVVIIALLCAVFLPLGVRMLRGKDELAKASFTTH